MNQDKQPLTTQANVVNLHASIDTEVLLAAAVVNILDQRGNTHPCRVLIDLCSQSHFMTKRMAHRLGLNLDKIEIKINGVNKTQSCINNSTNAVVNSRISDFMLNCKFLLVDEVACNPRTRYINKNELQIPSNIRLADPDFHKPVHIDALIGAEFFFQLLCVG